MDVEDDEAKQVNPSWPEKEKEDHDAGGDGPTLADLQRALADAARRRFPPALLEELHDIREARWDGENPAMSPELASFLQRRR